MNSSVLTIDARMLFLEGTGTYLQNLLKRLHFESLGLQVVVYVVDDSAADWMREFQPQAKVCFCNEPIYGYKDQLFWLKNLRGGIFWAPHFNIPWRGYEKLVVTIHDCAPLTQFSHPLVQLYGKVMFGRIRKKADAIITVSDFSRRELQALAKILDTPIHVIPNGIDPYWFTTQLPPKPYPFPYFVYVGNLKPHKNVVRLLQAYSKVRPEQKLVCVGPFKNLKLRDKKAYSLLNRMSENVIRLDRVSNEHIKAVVKNADALILPSLYEGFGLPPVEAMASRVPVLVSETSSLPEVCGESALYCDPFSVEGIAEGLEKLIGMSEGERKRRTEEGREFVARYNWDTAAKKTIQLFRSILN